MLAHQRLLKGCLPKNFRQQPFLTEAQLSYSKSWVALGEPQPEKTKKKLGYALLSADLWGAGASPWGPGVSSRFGNQGSTKKGPQDATAKFFG